MARIGSARINNHLQIVRSAVYWETNDDHLDWMAGAVRAYAGQLREILRDIGWCDIRALG